MDAHIGEGGPLMAPLAHLPAHAPQPVLEGFQGREGPMHHGCAIGIQFIAIGLQLQQAFQQGFLPAGIGGDGHLAPVFEEIGHATAFAEIAAVFAEGQAEIRSRAVAVVGEGIHQHGHASGAIALVAHLVQLDAVSPLAGALGDRPFNVRGRHASCLGFADGRSELEIAVGIRASPCRHHDLPAEAGEHGTPLGIHHRFGAFDL